MDPNFVLQHAPDCIKIVGNPLGTDAFCQITFAKRATKIIDDLPKLNVLRDGLAHFILLKACANTRFGFFMRCSPPRLTEPHARLRP